MEFWLSATGFPAEVVMSSDLLIIDSIFVAPNEPPQELLLKYLFPVIMIGIAYGNASASIRGGSGAHEKFLASRRTIPRFPALAQPANPKARGRVGRAVVRAHEARRQINPPRRSLFAPRVAHSRRSRGGQAGSDRRRGIVARDGDHRCAANDCSVSVARRAHTVRKKVSRRRGGGAGRYNGALVEACPGLRN